VFTDVTIHVGLRRLNKALEVGNYNHIYEMVYSLGTYEPKMLYRTHKTVEVGVGEDKTTAIILVDVAHKGKFLKQILQHILVCKVCNMYLYRFLELLDECIDRCRPYEGVIPNGGRDQINASGVPCYRYVLDADFDRLRECAYTAPLNNKEDEETDICNDIIKKFMEDHII
jgi:hypothetical protein